MLMISVMFNGMQPNQVHQEHEFLLAAHRVMEDHNLHFPSTIQEALDFYIELKTAMNIEMDRVNVS